MSCCDRKQNNWKRIALFIFWNIMPVLHTKFKRQHFWIVYLKYITSVMACTQLLMVTVDGRLAKAQYYISLQLGWEICMFNTEIQIRITKISC